MTTLREAAQQALAAMETADVDPHSSDAVYKAIDALKAALAEPVQEPVAYWNEDESLLAFKPRRGGRWTALYSEPKPCPTCVSLARTVMMDQTGYDPAPPQRKPLTDEEIGRICAPLGFAQLSPVEVARAIERAHGIGGQDD